MSGKEFRQQPHETRFLEFVSQERAIAMALVPTAIGRSPRAARTMVHRLRQSGQLQVTRMDTGEPGPWRPSPYFDDPDAPAHGPLWVFPGRETCWGYTDFDPGPWEPRPSMAAHMTAVTALRLALMGMETDPELWTSERLLYHRLRSENGQSIGHVHDAWFQDFTDPDKVWAVEVELTRKRGAGRLQHTMTAALDAADRHELAGVLYFVRGETLRRAVEATAVRIANKRGIERVPNLEIHDLDATLARKEMP
ncbi:hypothetical protein D7D52_34070 [Nocardia yunnanensis]|uniref:Protein involved in plasmid replication-relaxation n=1 Tax=Nocardia yunnanensis TaxID=2382165 RepID=A0A386ZLI3_9NOCA|nr:hypothetical protein [Nocardia yunnanensis]AYF78014.1 hypothetical protein D7D52_34070 [Nocardia yunnanensis]